MSTFTVDWDSGGSIQVNDYPPLIPNPTLTPTPVQRESFSEYWFNGYRGRGASATEEAYEETSKPEELASSGLAVASLPDLGFDRQRIANTWFLGSYQGGATSE